MDKLADAIEKFYAEKNNENLNLVVQEIMKAKLTAPVQVDVKGISNLDKIKEGGPVQPHKDMEIKLLNLTRDGKHFFPVFSGKEQMEKAPQSSTLEVTLKTYEKAATDPNIEGILVNPFSKSFFVNKDLLSAMLQALSGQQQPQQPQQQKNVRVSFFELDPYPTEMVYGARLVLMCETNVKSAYVMGMKNEDTQQATYLFIVKFDDGVSQEAIKNVFDNMNKEIRSYKPAMPISFMVNNNPLSQKATEGRKPFFRRYDDEEYENEKKNINSLSDNAQEKPLMPEEENDTEKSDINEASSSASDNSEEAVSEVQETATQENQATGDKTPQPEASNGDTNSKNQKKSWFKKLFGKGDN